MAVRFDASQSRDFTTGTGGTWTHVSVGVPAGMAVLIASNASTVDRITSVSYGGGTLARVAIIPGGSGSEPGCAYLYFRGTIVPASGTVNVVGTLQFSCWSVGMTANSQIWELTVAGTATVTSTSLANPSGTIAGLAQGTTGLALGVLFSGAISPATNAYNSGYTALPGSAAQGVDFGAQSANAVFGDVGSPGTVAVGWTAAADDVALIAALIREPAPAVLPPTVNAALEVV